MTKKIESLFYKIDKGVREVEDVFVMTIGQRKLIEITKNALYLLEDELIRIHEDM